MRQTRDTMTILPGGHDEVLARELAREKQNQRGDVLEQVVLQRDADGNLCGNRQARRVAKALARRGRLG